MTGPEHYREAEEHMAAIHGKTEKAVYVLLAKAQVHATLALAAATALPGLELAEWATAAGGES